jgi:hypothetical protein
MKMIIIVIGSQAPTTNNNKSTQKIKELEIHQVNFKKE